MLCEAPRNQPEAVYYTSPELAAILMEYCQQEENNTRDNLIVFIKNGLDQLGRIRKWYVNGRIEPNEAYSYFFHQLELGNVIICENMTVVISKEDDFYMVGTFCIVGTSDCSGCEKVKEYLEQNMMIVKEGLIEIPNVDMNKADLFTKK